MSTKDNIVPYIQNSNNMSQNILFISEKSLVLVNAFNEKAMLFQSYSKASEKSDNHTFNSARMIGSIQIITSIITSNQEYSNGNHIFSNDLNQAIFTIITALNSYIKSLNAISHSQNDNKHFLKILIDLENFTLSIFTFSTNLCEINNSIIEANKMDDSESTRKLNNLYLRLGIECTLFNFSVNVDPIDDFPFFKSNYVQVYHNYDIICSISEKIAPIKSFCGTGKTTCIPLILFCKNLKDNDNAPFILMTFPNQSHVNSKMELFKKLLSKYVDIESDEQKLLEILNSFEKFGEDQKLTFGLLTPYNLPRLMYNIKDKEKIISHIRLIIDDINQRSFHLSVILSRVLESYETLKLSMNVVFLSSAFPKIFKKEFLKYTKIVSLVKKPQFNISVKSVLIPSSDANYLINKIYQKLQKKIKSVLDKMIENGSEIEEGHILCFLPNTSFCNQLKNSIITEVNNVVSGDKKKKIVMLQTSLKPNESFESFSKRLLNEYDSIEKLRIDDKDAVFVYFLPLVISGISESTIYSLIQTEFPNIKKLIFSTPILESFNINNLSVVIDSGLIKEEKFDNKTCLNIYYEKQASQESMLLRYGRLGRTINGLYIFFFPQDKTQFEYQIPSIQKRDLTKNLLLMKQINIDFEKMHNLMDRPNDKNLDFSIRALKQIKAIDNTNFQITELGNELLKFEFIPIWYMAAVIRYSQSFSDELDKKFAYFITAYISTIITKDKLLIRDEMTELMSRFYDEDSDLITLFYALNSLLNSHFDNQEEFRNLVESYGFSYSNFDQLNRDLQKIVDYLFPGQKVNEIINSIDNFIIKNRNLHHIIDEFIDKIEYPNWKQIHMVRFNDVRNTDINKIPEIVFLADSKLAFFNNQPSGKVFLHKRPGWKGINVPTNCYCFNIQFKIERNRNQVFKKYIGHLIHRQRENRIKTIEIKSTIAMNPWFDVLLKTYLKDEDIGLVNNYKFGGNIFHYSNIGNSTYLSYISNRDDAEAKIQEAIDVCLYLINYTPKSVLIYNSNLESITEIYSIGSDKYDSLDGTFLNGCPLDRNKMELCMSNEEEMKKARSKIRIASLFVNESCELDDFDKSTLYLINMIDKGLSKILPHVQKRHKEIEKEKMKRNEFLKDASKTDFLQFSPKFIHPSLFYHKEAKRCIKKWLSNYCNNKIIESYQIINHKIQMKSSDIYKLKELIKNRYDEVKNEMKLNYVAIPFPRNIYEKNKLEISQHPTWAYRSSYNVVIVTKEEVENVINFINEKREKEMPNSFFIEKDLDSSLCISICEDERNPELINSPVSIWLQNEETISTKLCRNCLFERLCYVTKSYYSPKYMDIPPEHLYPIHSEEIVVSNCVERWPQIPFGQLITVLINNNDDELSSLVSTYLISINDYAIHHKMKYHFTFCPEHRQKIININTQGGLIRCREKNCKYIYCKDCHTMHPPRVKCDLKTFKDVKICPGCSNALWKAGGCNHMNCPCGTIFCYLCLKSFDTDTEAENHFNDEHGGSLYSNSMDDIIG